MFLLYVNIKGLDQLELLTNVIVLGLVRIDAMPTTSKF